MFKNTILTEDWVKTKVAAQLRQTVPREAKIHGQAERESVTKM